MNIDAFDGDFDALSADNLSRASQPSQLALQSPLWVIVKIMIMTIMMMMIKIMMLTMIMIMMLIMMLMMMVTRLQKTSNLDISATRSESGNSPTWEDKRGENRSPRSLLHLFGGFGAGFWVHKGVWVFWVHF